jgi:site-specific DNA-cytosine methylase
VAAQAGSVRGELAEPQVDIRVLTVGLFDGIATLRVAVDLLRVPLAGHVSVECNPQANRVVESAFRGSILVPNIQDVQMEAVMGWACQFSSVGLLLVGAGPPCQDVSTLNVPWMQRTGRLCRKMWG